MGAGKWQSKEGAAIQKGAIVGGGKRSRGGDDGSRREWGFKEFWGLGRVKRQMNNAEMQHHQGKKKKHRK